MQLRRYQKECINAIYKTLHKNVLVSIPTGCGKSLIQVVFLEEVLKRKPHMRFLLISHVKELLEQNRDELLGWYKNADVGIFSAGLGKKELKNSIIIAGVQSLYYSLQDIGHFDFIIIDEAHRFDDTSSSMYMQLYDALKNINPNIRVIGLTATPYRTQKGSLLNGSFWEEIVYSVNILDMIKEDYLSKVKTKGLSKSLDLSSVKKTAGEYVMEEAHQVMKQNQEKAIAEICVYGINRKSWLIFACNVKHAFEIKDLFEKQNVSCGIVVGEMPNNQRDQVIEDFKNNKYKAIVNVNILTTGFNVKQIDLIATLRPTKSPILYVQSVGRGMRLAPNKVDCLFLDYAGWINEFGPIDLIVCDKKKGFGKKPFKICPQCNSVLAIFVKVCNECYHVFESNQEKDLPNIGAEASNKAILSNQVEEFDILDTTYELHQKKDKPPSLKVGYITGEFNTIYEWICFEHLGYAKAKANQWWVKRGGKLPIPQKIEDALTRAEKEIKKPIHIKTLLDNKFYKIKEYIDVRA